MKLPASLLATVALAAGCEQAVDFEHRSAPTKEQTAKVAPVETVRVIEDRPYAQPPGAAPIVKTEPPAPLVIIKPTIHPKPIHKPKPKVAAHVCGPCGMG